jgi:non-ribosomal peptide synthetase component F
MNDNKQFNNNVADYPTGVTLQQMISAAAGKYPLEVASVYKNDRLTYRDLETALQSISQLSNCRRRPTGHVGRFVLRPEH